MAVFTQNEIDYINLTDMTASFREGSGLIGKWITNKNTLEYLRVWEKINNSVLITPNSG
ncbi:KilA-N domain-containing protein [Sphingobacterium paramultivorum]|uniref:KilA-N domain-containing protein n=1 Tax=Sphingobacterium paramultivorum TaxID=2886510 RepID=UPI0037435915